jgi:hypothetical protein
MYWKRVLSVVLAVVSLLALAGAGLAAPAATWSVRGEGGVWVSAAYEPGRTYWGRNHYIEYIAGDLPIVISAPHGGYLKPEEIPDLPGSGGEDTYSQEYTRAVADHILHITGHRPHVIINHLHRSKMNANRDIDEAANGNPYAEQAWNEFHGFIEAAKTTVAAQWGEGHYFDFHTSAHSAIELGYLLMESDLVQSDATLENPTYRNRSSLRSLADNPGIYFPELLRGATSLGGLLAGYGYTSIPSPAQPAPGGEFYYNGGYNTWRHGSRYAGAVNGTQVETPWQFAAPNSRDAFSLALANTIVNYLETHYHYNLEEVPPIPMEKAYLPLVVRIR